MSVSDGFVKHVVDGVRYSAHNVIPGSMWMIKRYKDSRNDAYYIEQLLSSSTFDELTAIHAAIANGTWA